MLEHSHFAPTQTTCQIRFGTADTQDAITYKHKTGVINTATPGVVFYYASVPATTAGAFGVAVSQSDTGGSPPFGVVRILVCTANCVDGSAVPNQSTVTYTYTTSVNGVAIPEFGPVDPVSAAVNATGWGAAARQGPPLLDRF